MLFDHHAKVGGDSARFADLPAAGSQEKPGRSACRKEEAVLGYRGECHVFGKLRTEMTALLALAAAAASETGLVRQDNEDVAYAGRWLFAVADGLGGHAAGEVASLSSALPNWASFGRGGAAGPATAPGQHAQQTHLTTQLIHRASGRYPRHITPGPSGRCGTRHACT